MISICRMDLHSGVLTLDWTRENREELHLTLQRMAPFAEALGIGELLLVRRGGSDSTRNLRRAEHRRSRQGKTVNPTINILGPSLERVRQLFLAHDFTKRPDGNEYVGRFVHDMTSLPVISAYLGMLLTCYGGRVVHRHHLQLALYEICANLLEHGKPRQDDAPLLVRVYSRDSSVEGWVEDGCVSFDLLAVAVPPLDEKVAERHPRGYGIPMIHKLLDDFHYEPGATRNRFHFKKRIER